MRVSVAAYAVGLFFVSALPVRAEVTVEVTAGRIDLTARNAPLSEVLRRLSEQTGMKVSYEGAPPRDLVTVSLAGRSPVEAVTDLLKERKLNYALAVDATGHVNTLIIVSAERPQAVKEMTRPSIPAAPSPPPAPVVGSLLDLLDQSGSRVDESLRAEWGAGAPEPELKLEEVLPPEMLERLSVPTEASPVALPEESLLRLLLPAGQPPSGEPRAPAGAVEKPTGAEADPRKLPPDPAQPPLR